MRVTERGGKTYATCARDPSHMPEEWNNIDQKKRILFPREICNTGVTSRKRPLYTYLNEIPCNPVIIFMIVTGVHDGSSICLCSVLTFQ